MIEKAKIFGTMGGPYTHRASEAYEEKAVFLDVESDPKLLEEMLKLSNARRNIPVIAEGDRVLIGSGWA